MKDALWSNAFWKCTHGIPFLEIHNAKNQLAKGYEKSCKKQKRKTFLMKGAGEKRQRCSIFSSLRDSKGKPGLEKVARLGLPTRTSSTSELCSPCPGPRTVQLQVALGS